MTACAHSWLGFLLVAVTAMFAHGWEGVYMVHSAQPEDFVDLNSRGVKQVIQNVTGDPHIWDRYYSAAVEHDLMLIPILWGARQSAWSWNEESKEWELCVRKYPGSTGARFLDFLRRNPRYLARTFAVYAFHEPMNPQNQEALVSPTKQRKFWEQIRTEEFPQGTLKIYGENVTWHEDCRNGCVDYDSITLYHFVRSDNRDLYRPMYTETLSSMRIRAWADARTADRSKAIESGRRVIDTHYKAAREAPPASDGSRTAYIVLIQTFAMSAPNESCNRLPSAAEMRGWAKDIVIAEKDRIAGMGWYCYGQAAGHYTHWLHKDRYDERGDDRWQAIGDVGQQLFPGNDRRPE